MFSNSLSLDVFRFSKHMIMSLVHNPTYFFLFILNNLYTFLLPYSLVTQLVKNPPAMQETLVGFLGWEDPLERG